MNLSPRSVHLVGSIPADDPEQAMRTALGRLGPHLRMLADGETGERRNWIVHIIKALEDHPDLELAKPGDWSDYEHGSRLKIRRGHRLRGETLDFGHVASFETSYQVLRSLDPDLTFQVGIPGDLDMALFALGPVGAFRHRSPFTAATIAEIQAIHARAGSDVLFQFELPVELVFMARMPGPAQPAMAAFLARGVTRLARMSPTGTRFGIHLCLGDLGNKALGRMRDVRPLVTLANALVRRWPDGRPLEYVHAPFAAGDEPAPVEGPYYGPLTELRLPSEVRFVAGFVHEKRDDSELRRTLQVIEDRVGRRVDVATACGLGRRSPEAAAATMDRAATLVTA